MIDGNDMPARLNRALQVRSADRLRATLARDPVTGLPLIGGLSDEDQRELRDGGGGRLAAIVFCVSWLIEAPTYPHSLREVAAVVMREVAGRIGEQVRRTDLLGWLSENTLVILAPALDAETGRSLAERLRELVADVTVEVSELQVQLRIRVGVASRSATSPGEWTIGTLADEAEATASRLPPPAIVA